jgi:hypothetical protein
MLKPIIRPVERLLTRSGFATVTRPGVLCAAVALEISARVFPVKGGATYIAGCWWDFTTVCQDFSRRGLIVYDTFGGHGFRSVTG